MTPPLTNIQDMAEINYGDLKHKLNNSELKELLFDELSNLATGNVEHMIFKYQADPNYHVYGAEENSECLGFIIFHLPDPDLAVIQHICMRPIQQKTYLVSTLLKHLQDTLPVKEISAESDKHHLPFYQEAGFTCTISGEKYQCVWMRNK